MNYNIQILALREHQNSKTNLIQKVERWFEKGYRAPSVREIYADPEKYLKPIPKEERYNVYYTVANCLEEKGRKLAYQDVIPFDIDKIDFSKKEELARVACKAIGVEYEKSGILFSGHGVQIMVETTTRIVSDDYFELTRAHYKAICERVSLALAQNKLEGTVDPTVWSAARLMRYPNTLNVKKDHPDIDGHIMQANIEPQDYNIELKSGLPIVGSRDHITVEQYKRYPAPDSEAIKGGCEFLKWNYEHADEVLEPQWYAALSIVGRLENGAEEAQIMSRGHKHYSSSETAVKLDQAMLASGPRTCTNINALWGKCSTCAHYQTNITSPIMIQGPDHIRTKGTGFYNMAQDAEGNLKKGKPNYKDLAKFLDQKSPFISTESHTIYKYGGTHWSRMPILRVKEFAEKNFDPEPDEKMRVEFLRKVQVHNVSYQEERLKYVAGRLNLQNGVLNLRTKELEPHSKDFFFQNILPYEYDPQAKAPRFEQFMEEITLGRGDIARMLLEYAGYCFSSDIPWLEKCLVLIGNGSNGKSKFCDVLKMLAGSEATTGLMIKDLKNEQLRARLDGALFNIGEESDARALIDAEAFLKSFVSGGVVNAKIVYEPALTFECRTKFIFTLNDFPQVNDMTEGLRRRLLVVPFDAAFTHDNGKRDNFLMDKFKLEMPGILNMIVDAYGTLMERGKLETVESVEKMTDESFALSDTVHNWVKDVVEFRPDQETVKREIYDSYKNYCYANGDKPLVNSIFFKQFKGRYPQLVEKRRKIGDRKARITGLMVLSDY